MLHLFPPLRGAGAFLLLLLASPLTAQAPQLDADARPRVERLTFRGVSAVNVAELRRSIITEETRCRGLLVRPFCWLTDWDVFIDKNYLDPEELPRDVLRVRVFYSLRGFREARVTGEARPRGRGVEVVFTVDEGPPTLIDSIAVRQTDEVLPARTLGRAALPRAGDPLNLVALDSAVTRISTLLGQRGYLDARLRDSVAVVEGHRLARVVVEIEPGRRATLEELVVRGTDRIDERTIRDAVRLRRGSVLRQQDIAGTQRSLYESNLFHEVRVRVPEQADSAKQLEIEVREAPVRAAMVGGGFNTVEFIQTEGRFTHYDWLGGGRRLDVRGSLGNLLAPQLNDRGIFRDVVPDGFSPIEDDAFLRPLWQASVDFQQPSFRGAPNTLGMGLFASRRSVPGIAIDRGFGGSLSFTRRLDYRAPVSLGYRYEVTSVAAADLYFCVNYTVCDLPTIRMLRERQSLSPVNLSFFNDRTEGPLTRTGGYQTRLDLEHASAFTLSDYRYNRISGEASYYLPVAGRRRIVAARLRAGWVQPLESTGEAIGLGEEGELLLHPRKRFYAGGSQSVRGYGENQLGPRILTVDPAALTDEELEDSCTLGEVADGSCDPNAAPVSAFLPRPLGGRSVVQANVEYRFPVWRQLSGAVFIDAAIVGEEAGRLISEGVGAVTPGFGARYQSPVGPIRVDLGVRPRLVEQLPVVTEVVAENGERRIIRLETPRRYDPLEDTGRGILRQVFNRLTLHLSIGQAF